ncbi:MAG: hypothetical protein WCK01_00475 [Candidatus Uhrbacteria bacterium]
MRRHERGADPGQDFIRTIEIKNKDGSVVERKEVVSAKGLLHLAHKERLSKIRTTVVQSPSKENGETAIVVVLVVTQRGAFTALGDANPRNVNVRIAPHFIRMAETRALARSLRAALDIDVAAIEELEDEFSYVDGKGEQPRRHERRDEPRPQPTGRDRDEPGSASHSPAAIAALAVGGADGRMSDNQRKLLYRLASERGFTGEDARLWLHEELGVDSLDKVSMRAASAFIDQLKQANGQNGHAAG